MNSRPFTSSKRRAPAGISALALVVVLGLFSATQANASLSQKSRTLEPEAAQRRGDWMVRPIETDGGSDAQYCSMKAAYDNGHELVFARDDKGVNSLAVDFGRDKLETGKQYGVVLGVLPYVMRQMTAVAATPRVLIMQLGRDTAFYDAVRQHDKMAVVLPSTGESAAFSLDGTARALSGLDGCLASINPSYMPDSDREVMAELFADDVAGIAPAAGAPGLEITIERPGEENDRDENPGNMRSSATTDGVIDRTDVLEAENKALALEKQTVEARLDAQAKKLELERALGQEALMKKEAEVAALKAALEEARKQRPLTAAVAPVPHQVGTADKADGPAVAKAEPAAFRDSLRDIIVSARVARPEDVSEDAGYSGAGLHGYSWQAEGIFGAAQRIGHAGGQDYSAIAEAYVQHARGLCPGDFAVNREAVEKLGRLSVQKSEIACIGGNAESVAALLFVDDGKVLTVVSHETAPDLATAALARRDAFLKGLAARGAL